MARTRLTREVRILLITQFFDPEPTFKGLLFARELARRGHDVQVITGFPNYPGGRIYPGYRVRPLQRESRDGVEVYRVPLYPSHDRSAIRRVGNYASFALSATVLGMLLTRRPDVVYVYHPPATIGLAAMAQRFLRGVPVVYDIQDLWPDTLRATGMVDNGIVLRAVDVWCRAVYRAASRLVVLSPGFKTRLVERGVPAERIDVIYNWCDEAGMAPAPPDKQLAVQLGLDARSFVVLFAGTMGLAQGLDVVIDAATRLAEPMPHVNFVLIGGGLDRARLVGRVAEAGLRNVHFVEPRPMHAMGPVLALADALLVHLRDDPLFHITIPSKTQAYLAAGKPVLMGVRGDARSLVEEAGAGLGFTPEDGAALAAAVIDLATRSASERAAMGAAGAAFYQNRLSLAVGTDAFERTFASAVAA
ncbi:MAG: glycosyltransferase family 4 protein [Gemmatimonadaceae bacterium]|nr:glycosyltransferase family 4 protein [Gemmatimonadaceae bacterium]